MEHKKTPLFNRRNFIRAVGMGSVGSFAYARWIEPNYLTVTRKEIHLPELPPALDGTVIAQLTDFHYQPDSQDELMAKAIAATNQAKPDFIFLTGDFITKSPKVLTPLMEHLSGLRAKHGIYGIMGNHDGWHSRYAVFEKAFKRAGFEFLINAGSRISLRGDPLYILGTDSIWSGDLDLPACYRGQRKNDFVLAMVHEPDVFDIITESHRVDLQLSGHTHGGQCRVPLVGYAPVKVQYGEKYIYGEFAKDQSRLFVSRGLGTVGTKVRFACAPEVAILTLRASGIKKDRLQ